MTDGRPFASKGIEDLEGMESRARTDSVLRDALMKELTHRKTRRAGALMNRLRNSDFPSDTTIVTESGESVTIRDLRDDLENLRATFTEAGELLARWGMTEAMPVEMRDEIFRMWRMRLEAGDAPPAKSLASLTETIDRLKRMGSAPLERAGTWIAKGDVADDQ